MQRVSSRSLESGSHADWRREAESGVECSPGIAEDEAAATAAGNPQFWRHDDQPLGWSLEIDGERILTVDPGTIAVGNYWNHAARHLPARVLAECAAKRQIIDFCAETLEDSSGGYTSGALLAERVLSADCGCLMNILGHAAWKDKQAGLAQPSLPGEHIASFLLRRTAK